MVWESAFPDNSPLKKELLFGRSPPHTLKTKWQPESTDMCLRTYAVEPEIWEFRVRVLVACRSIRGYLFHRQTTKSDRWPENIERTFRPRIGRNHWNLCESCASFPGKSRQIWKIKKARPAILALSIPNVSTLTWKVVSVFIIYEKHSHNTSTKSKVLLGSFSVRLFSMHESKTRFLGLRLILFLSKSYSHSNSASQMSPVGCRIMK